MEKIDFVITWVDSEDPKWQREKEKYSPKKSFSASFDNRKERYRDMGTLKYFFRAIDKYAPWVNKVYFVTCGQKPQWLDENCEKLVLVNHSDYMPQDCLPTFNSNAIEASLHRIEGLSEHFVYFNDDMFIVNPVSPEDFFRNGLPVDTLSLEPILATGTATDGFFKKIANNVQIINKYFSFRPFFKKNWRKVLSFSQGLKYWIRTATMCNYPCFSGFHCTHLPNPYLKSVWQEVWEKEPDILNATMSFRFRNNRDSVNHWLFQYWQFASGRFETRKQSFGKLTVVGDRNLIRDVTGNRYKVLCINDDYDNENFEQAMQELIDCFERKLPEKSQFEK